MRSRSWGRRAMGRQTYWYDEVQRLDAIRAHQEARIAGLEAEVAALRPIAEAVAAPCAALDNFDQCVFCDGVAHSIVDETHAADCPVTLARAALHKATPAAQPQVVRQSTQPCEHDAWEHVSSHHEVVDDEGGTQKWRQVRCRVCGIVWEHP